jgi:hypothetical protein
VPPSPASEHGRALPLSWLRHVLSSAPRKLRLNLGAVYVIHATLQLRLLLWLVSPFVSRSFWHSLCYIDQLEQLHDHFEQAAFCSRRATTPGKSSGLGASSSSSLLPRFVLQYDQLRDSPLAVRARALRDADVAELAQSAVAARAAAASRAISAAAGLSMGHGGHAQSAQAGGAAGGSARAPLFGCGATDSATDSAGFHLTDAHSPAKSDSVSQCAAPLRLD